MDDRDRAVSRNPLPVVRDGVLESILASTGQNVDTNNLPELANSHGGSFVSHLINNAQKSWGGALEATKDAMEGNFDHTDPEQIARLVDFSLGAAQQGAMRGAVSKPSLEPTFGTFIGTKAKNIDKSEMRLAKKGLDEGYDRADVFGDTGWLRDPTGVMKKEIGDVDAQLMNKLPIDINHRLGDVFDHPEIFKNYPDLRETFLKMDPSLASNEFGYSIKGTRGEPGSIGLNPTMNDKKQLEILLHEIQHQIQGKEGHVGGYNPQRVQEDVIRNASEEVINGATDMDKISKLISSYGNLPEHERELLNHRLYLRNLGEAEAKLTQVRGKWDNDSRLSEHPYDTLNRAKDYFGFAEKDIIVPRRDINQ